MLSIPHLIVIFVVALVVFGPEKIPELARNLGKVMAEFRRVTGDLRSTFEGHLRDLEREADQRRIAAPNAAVVPTAAAPADPPLSPGSSSPAPGTVPSSPPNAAVMAKPESEASAANFNAGAMIPDPGDPMHDPFLMQAEFPPRDSAPDSESPAAEPSAERVTDGDGRVS